MPSPILTPRQKLMNLQKQLDPLDVQGEYVGYGQSGAVLKEPQQTSHWGNQPMTSNYLQENLDKNKAVSGKFYGPDSEKARRILELLGR